MHWKAMTGNSRADDLITEIYDVVTNPERWPRVLDALSEYMGAVAATLIYSDTEHNKLERLWASSRLHGFFEAEENLDIMAGRVDLYRELPKVFPARGWICREDLSNRSLAWNWAGYNFTEMESRLQGFLGKECYPVMSPLNIKPNYFDLVTLHFPRFEAAVDVEERLAGGEIFLSHLAKAIELSRPYLLLQQRSGVVFSVLDRLQLGVVVLGEDQRVWLQNRSATRIIERGTCLRLNATGQLEGCHETSRKMLADAAEAVVSMHDVSQQHIRLVLPCLKEEQAYMVDISLLEGFDPGRDGSLRGLADGSLRGLVMVLAEPGRTNEVDCACLKEVFGLTQREAEVAKLLAEGQTNSRIAGILNVSPNTVGTHSRSLYAKMNIHNRAKLAQLVHSANLPLVEELLADH